MPSRVSRRALSVGRCPTGSPDPARRHARCRGSMHHWHFAISCPALRCRGSAEPAPASDPAQVPICHEPGVALRRFALAVLVPRLGVTRRHGHARLTHVAPSAGCRLSPILSCLSNRHSPPLQPCRSASAIASLIVAPVPAVPRVAIASTMQADDNGTGNIQPPPNLRVASRSKASAGSSGSSLAQDGTCSGLTDPL